MRSSKPSRRISSIRIPSWSSPLAYMVVFSGSLSDFSAFSVTLLSVSYCRRSRTFAEDRIVPSFPERGPVFAPNSMHNVGGARGGVGMGAGTGLSFLVSVSPTAISSGTPAIVTISPATAGSFSSTLWIPL